MSPLLAVYKSHVRRNDPPAEEEDEMDTIVVVTYAIAFLAATALTIYIVAYFKPPRQWHWYCRLRGWPVAPDSPLTSPPTWTSTSNDYDDDDRRNDHGVSWDWKSFLSRMRRGRGQGDARKSSIPSNAIRRTAVYTVHHDPVPHHPSKPVRAVALPVINGGKDNEGANEPSKKTRVYGGGKLPWGQTDDGTDDGNSKTPRPQQHHANGAQQGGPRMGEGAMI